MSAAALTPPDVCFSGRRRFGSRRTAAPTRRELKENGGLKKGFKDSLSCSTIKNTNLPASQCEYVVISKALDSGS